VAVAAVTVAVAVPAGGTVEDAEAVAAELRGWDDGSDVVIELTRGVLTVGSHRCERMVVGWHRLQLFYMVARWLGFFRAGSQSGRQALDWDKP
jgi:hypothetical protein